MDQLGDFSKQVFVVPGDTNTDKEVWTRKRVAILRSLIEHYPYNEWIVPSLQELWFWMYDQQRLFLRVKDSFGAAELLPSGLYRAEGNDSKYESFDREYEEMSAREAEMAETFLATHPNSQGAAWAYYSLLGNLETKLFQSVDDDFFTAVALREEILLTLTKRQEYRSRNSFKFEHESVKELIEHFDEFDVDAAMAAVDSFRNEEHTEQIGYLEQVRRLFPDNKSLEEKYWNLQSLEKPFSLAFKDLLSGETIDTRDFRGRVVLIDIWATWCQPCLQGIRFLKNFRDSHKDLGLEIVGLACDRDYHEEESRSNDFEVGDFRRSSTAEERVRECAVQHRIDWPVLVDEKFRDQWAITSIPRMFVVDRQGKLCWIAQDNSVFEFVRDLLKK